MDAPIYFFGEKAIKNGYLSNFYPCEFKDAHGTSFVSSEQFFMYIKALTFDPSNQNLLINILQSRDPRQVKKFGRQVRNYNDSVWNEKGYNVMLHALWYKFTQNPELKAKLLSTGNSPLYEASKYDAKWGIGMTSTQAVETSPENYGSNLLGKALMEVRKLIRENPQ